MSIRFTSFARLTPSTGSPNAAGSEPAAVRGWGRLAAASGQATAEYALVMLAAAALAGLLVAWATSTDGVARLMNAVLDSLIGDVTS